VIEELTLNVNSHQNPFKINFDDQTDPLLVNMLYQANEILLMSGRPVFQLEQSSDENSVSVSMSNDNNFTGQDLNEWLENVEELPGTSFVFRAEEVENRLHWKVSSFLEPVSSVDADNSTSVGNSNESKPSDKENMEEVSEESNADEVSDEPSIEKLPMTEVLGSNWYNTQGIGLFFDAGNGWIYHIEMGWCFLKICNDQASFWMFHDKLGWFWMNQQIPNMLFLINNSTEGWYYFPQNTLAESKYIYGYNSSTWYNWNQ
jgi:hypothetical protein